jgi:hypothetical protein
MEAEGIVSEEAVSSLIRLALACEVSKRPLRREDVISLILGESGSRNFRPLLNEANIRLRQVFSMQLVPLPTNSRSVSTLTVAGRKAATSKKTDQQSLNSYILLSVEGRPVGKFHRQPERLAILATILSLVNLSENAAVQEDVLLEKLSLLSITPSTFPLADYLSELRRQKYINVTKNEERVDVYQVGPRGQLEFPPKALAAFICELANYTGQPSQISERISNSLHLNKS